YISLRLGLGAVLTTEVDRRRSQAERTAGTRARLLDATVACVAELGYAKTTTTEVVRRAGMSRGAQVHHFPTKADLVLAALDWVLDRRRQEFRAAFADLPPQRRNLAAAIDLLWQAYQGPTFLAWLELAVAGRSDPALAAGVEEITANFEDRSRELFAELFPGAGHSEQSATSLALAFAVLDGVALQRAVGVGTGTGADAVVELLKGLGALMSVQIGGWP
ncbi:MAG: TetR/AcrR family transcriptional regulator, partial [Actinomycetota bacterium]|nr:TetR/AcrR family transcriptional regulator [Actinomycetota bacterium]